MATQEISGPQGEVFGSVVKKAMHRRSFLKGATSAGAALVIVPAVLRTEEASAKSHRWRRDSADRLTFETVPPGNERDVTVPPQYEFNII